MGSTFGQILPLAVGIVLSPLPIVAVILMLFTARARANSTAFLAGWLGGLLLVGGAALALSDATGAAGSDGKPSDTSGIVKLVLGILLLLLAVRSWRSRPAEGEQPKLPRWMNALDTFTTTRSAVFGALLSSVNPKNLALLLAAVATISASTASGGQQFALLVAFAIVASLGIAVPVVTNLAMGARAEGVLTPAKDWLSRNNAGVMAVILLIFGAKLIGDAISILSA